MKSPFRFSVIRHRDVMILTRRPETSEYFLAGLKDGGASILKSGKKQKKKLTKLALKHSDPFPFSSKNIA